MKLISNDVTGIDFIRRRVTTVRYYSGRGERLGEVSGSVCKEFRSKRCDVCDTARDTAFGKRE